MNDNIRENRQFRAAVREIERLLSRRLSLTEVDRLHRDVTGRNLGYHELIEAGLDLFQKDR